MPSTAPLVSVVLPVFNAAPFLAAAAGSILQQTHANLELLLLDDGSTDGSSDIVRTLAQQDRRVRPFSRENRGLIATLNEGLAAARGDLVARMDADDIAYPDRLAKQVAAFADQPGLGVCGGGYDLARNGRVLHQGPNPLFQSSDLGTLSVFFTIFIHPSVMFDRAVVGDQLYYDAAYPHAEDFDLFRRLARDHPCRVIGDSLLIYRLHDQSVTQRHGDVMRKTHLRIVSENLRARNFTGDIASLEDIVTDPTGHNVQRAGAFWRDLGDQIEDRDLALRASFMAGRQNLFYFLYVLVLDLWKPALIRQFLDSSEGWNLIRRWEALAHRVEPAVPGAARLAVSTGRAASDLLFHLRSRPIATLHDRAAA